MALKITSSNKLFWNYVRKHCKTAAIVGNLKVKDGKTVEDDVSNANVLNAYFASIFKVSQIDNIFLQTRKFETKLEIFEMTTEDVQESFSEINPNNSIGTDNIHPNSIVECKEELCKLLSIIFNKSLNEGKVPKIWKYANITPIFNSGSINDPENY